MKKAFLLLTSALCIQAALQAQSVPTLRELVDSALKQDATLVQQKLQNRLTHLDQEKLNDIFLPKVAVSGKSGYLYASTKMQSPEMVIPAVANIFPGMTVPEGYLDNNLNISGISVQAGAEASMLLYSGGKVKHLKEANKEKDHAENILMEKSREDVVAYVSKVYDQFALLNESANVLQKGKERLEIMKKTADKALGYGLITPYDHKKIELAQATLDSKIIEYESKREVLTAQLAILSGIEEGRIRGILPRLKPIELLAGQQTITNRAELRALDHAIKAVDYKIKAEQTWWIPKVMAKASASYIGLYSNHITTSKDIIPGTVDRLNWRPDNLQVLPIVQAGVGFKWDLFDGKEGKNTIARARVERQVLESKVKDAQDKLQLNHANSLSNYKVANAQIALKEKAREIAGTALSNIEKEFRYGTKKSADYIEAENDLENAELEYQTAIFNQRRAAIELMKSTQELDFNKL